MSYEVHKTEYCYRGIVKGYHSEGVAEYIQELFGDNFKGICIDVGAHDSRWLSNSFMLEVNGWQTFCIEPNPNCAELLKERKNVYQYAMGKENRDDVDFFIYEEGQGPKGEAGGTSMADRSSGSKKSQVKVNLRTLNWFIEHQPLFPEYEPIDHVDFISIDTEGNELDVLDGIDLAKWKVKAVCVEDLARDGKVQTYMTQRGFKHMKQMVWNEIYTNFTA